MRVLGLNRRSLGLAVAVDGLRPRLGQRQRCSSSCIIDSSCRSKSHTAILLFLCFLMVFFNIYVGVSLGGSSSSSSSSSFNQMINTVFGLAYNNVASGGNKQINVSNLKYTNEHILQVLNTAKIASVSEDIAKQLPSWEDITSMYGDKPVIHGLDTCEHYRNMVKPEDRTIGPAGLFNTGTNLIWTLMETNCNIDGKILWQAPWGKHAIASSRLKRVAWSGGGINQTEFFPFVMIKDPFSWMNSQCRHDYGATFWYSDYDEEHCPNLIRGNVPDGNETAPVRLFKYGTKHDSLLDVWNYYYGEWEAERTKFPHLVIRYEDLLFHGREVSKIACECVGGNITTDFQYEAESAKGSEDAHKGANGFVKALLQYGDPAVRVAGFTDRDMWYARRNNATTELMKEYVYSDPVL